jgi:5-bromo-4-chloroindolyl phosphate hydrolysis protein
MKKIIKVNGKKYKAINEDITSSGYSQLKKPLHGATLSIKILNRALKQQHDDKVVSEIEYLYEKAEEMLKIVEDKKYST